MRNEVLAKKYNAIVKNKRNIIITFTVITMVSAIIVSPLQAFASESDITNEISNNEGITTNVDTQTDTKESSNKIISSLANNAIDKAKEKIDNYEEEHSEEIEKNVNSSKTFFMKMIDWIVDFFKKVMHSFLVTSKEDLVETLNDEIKAQSKEVQANAINNMSEIAKGNTSSNDNVTSNAEVSNVNSLQGTVGMFGNLLATQ